jgi:hypothetical protein
MLRLYVIGVFILVIAIICNFLVSKLGIASWYDFLISFTKNEPNNYNFFDYIWLFIIYPLCLGLGYYIGDLVFNYFVK